MEWLHRRLRMKKMKEWKRWKPLHKQLRRRGYKGPFEKISYMALLNRLFEAMELVDLVKI